MIVSNRDLRNIQLSTSAFLFTTSQIDCIPASLAINIDLYKKVNNFDNVRRRPPSLSRIISKSASVESKIFSIPYYKRMVIQNNFPKEEFREPIDCSQLSYNN